MHDDDHYDSFIEKRYVEYAAPIILASLVHGNHNNSALVARAIKLAQELAKTLFKNPENKNKENPAKP